MPQFAFSTAMTANQIGLNPLVGWQYEFNPYGRAIVKLLVRATTAGVRLSVTTGSTQVQEPSPVQGGGTAGTTPTDFTTSAVQWIAQGGDRLKLAFNEVLGGTPTIDGVIFIEPM